jgi:hypothetical protein
VLAVLRADGAGELHGPVEAGAQAIDALIEPYPLPCYSDMSQLPRIKLARGRFIEMVAP